MRLIFSLLLFLCASVQAQPPKKINAKSMWHNPQPTIAVSTSSLSAMETTEGTASDPESFTVSGSNLTDDITVTPISGIEISLSSGSGYTASALELEHLAGAVSSTTIYARIAASASAGSISGNIVASSPGAESKNVAVTGEVEEVVTTYLDSARFIFSGTARSVSGWTNISGDPGQGYRSATGAYGIGVNNVAASRWYNGFGGNSSNTVGVSGGNDSFPPGTLSSYWFEYILNRTDTSWNIEITGLDPAGTYMVQCMGARDAAGVATERYTCYEIYDSAGTQQVNKYTTRGNTDTIATFHVVKPFYNGTVRMAVMPWKPQNANHQFGYLNAMKIFRTPRTED